MSAESNKKIVQDFFDACARHDLDGAAALFADEGINHGDEGYQGAASHDAGRSGYCV